MDVPPPPGLSLPLKEIETASRKIEKDLHRVATRCCQNNLLINPEKTKFLLVGTRQLTDKMPTFPSLSFLGKTLKPVDSAKDLGVTLDSHLTYTSHISNLFSTCISKLCQINRVKQSFDKDTLILMITSLVFNKLFYCSCVWSNTSAANIKQLQLVQNSRQQDRNRDKEIRSCHLTLTSTQVATCRTDIIPRGCCYGVQMYKRPCTIVPTK